MHKMTIIIEYLSYFKKVLSKPQIFIERSMTSAFYYLQFNENTLNIMFELGKNLLTIIVELYNLG